MGRSAEFHPADPFPYLSGGTYSEPEAQTHAQRADEWLGLDTLGIETKLAKTGLRQRAPDATGVHQELWLGLALTRLLTPYLEIRTLLECLGLRPDDTVVDLGAGYGRMGFVIGRHFPQVQFVGYEYVGERVCEFRRIAARLKYRNVKMVHSDLTSPDLVLPPAQFYFMYDYGNAPAIEKTLYDLWSRGQQGAMVLIARGKTCRALIERGHPWLKAATHLGSRTTIYRSTADF